MYSKFLYKNYFCRYKYLYFVSYTIMRVVAYYKFIHYITKADSSAIRVVYKMLANDGYIITDSRTGEVRTIFNLNL